MKLLKYLEHINYENSNESIQHICKELDIKNYTINSDFSIDVDGDVSLYRGLSDNKLTELPLTFNKVTGSFNCSGNKLSSLKGSPREVGKHFLCSFNLLTTLSDGPLIVGENYQCGDNLLTKLDMPCTELILLTCINNKINTLAGMPYVRTQFSVRNNRLESLKYLNCDSDCVVYCDNNDIYELSINDKMPISYRSTPIFYLIYFIKVSNTKLKSLDDYEIVERLDEFDVLDNNKLDILNMNKLFDFYNVLFNEEEFIKNLTAYTREYEIH